jgi:hypothetical protein
MMMFYRSQKRDLVLTGHDEPAAEPRGLFFLRWQEDVIKPAARMDRTPSATQRFHRHSHPKDLADYNQAIEGEGGFRKP